MKTEGIDSARVIVVSCSKCKQQFTDTEELSQTCYHTVKDAVEALTDWGWIVRNKKVLCEDCQ